MLHRFASLALVSALAAGCAVDVVSSESPIDELHRTNPGATILVPDAGHDLPVLRRPPRSRVTLPAPVLAHDCRDACPGPCARDEACCASTQRCVSLSCPTCCPDPEFAFDAIRTAIMDHHR
ncbi:MAG TPA: hypothetical protein VIL20_01485 [Sandaracinaceae bacterium]